MNRQEMIDNLMWLESSSGTGTGPCSFAFLMLWALREPLDYDPATGRCKDDLKSVVAIGGNPEDYTDEELRILYDFHVRKCTQFDAMFRHRANANLNIIEKVSNRWLRKRMTWDMGPMYSDTLQEAISILE